MSITKQVHGKERREDWRKRILSHTCLCLIDTGVRVDTMLYINLKNSLSGELVVVLVWCIISGTKRSLRWPAGALMLLLPLPGSTVTTVF